METNVLSMTLHQQRSAGDNYHINYVNIIAITPRADGQNTYQTANSLHSVDELSETFPDMWSFLPRCKFLWPSMTHCEDRDP